MNFLSRSVSRKTARFALVGGIVLLTLACNFPFKKLSAGNEVQTPSAVGAPTAAADILSADERTAHACQIYTAPVEVANADPAVPTPLFKNRTTPEGVIHWLVLGSDYRPEAGFRTDTIILVTIDQNQKTIHEVSFPRDLYVTIPGWTTQRINTAMAQGGFSMLQDTFAYNFGICPSGFVMTNFEGFQNMINSLGGVDVNVQKDLADTCDLPAGSSLANGSGWCSVSAGVQHMDGASALWYVRSRYSTSDFERLRRAQEVTLAIFRKMLSDPTSVNLSDLFSQYQDSIQTNLTVADVLPLLPLASQVASDPARIQGYTIAPPLVHGFITQGGGDVQLPDFAAIDQVLDQAIPSGN